MTDVFRRHGVAALGVLSMLVLTGYIEMRVAISRLEALSQTVGSAVVRHDKELQAVQQELARREDILEYLREQRRRLHDTR